MATINEMRQVATQIENETQVGGNTASRVGGLFNDVVDKLEDDETDINIVKRVEITYKQCQIPNKYINDTNVGSALSLQSNNDYGVFYFFVRKGQSFAISSTYVAPSASRLYIFHLDEDLDIVQRYENVVVGTTTYTATEDCIVVGTLYGNDSIQYTGIQKAYLVNGKMNEVGLTGANIIQHLKDLEADIDNDITNLNTEVGALENEVFGTPLVSNLPLPNDGVLNANGTISLYEDWYNSDYFAVDSAKQYTYNGSIYGGGNILYYDSAKNLLGTCANIPENYADRTNPVELNDMPSNAAYIRVSGYDISACSITESDSLRPKVENIEERIDNLTKPQGIIEPVFGATLANPVRIKLLGDSITQGWGGSNFDQDGAEIYPLGEGWQTHRNLHGYCWANMMRDYLETKYHCTVVNNAITGTSTRNIVTRLDDFIDAADDIVICAYGTNNRNNYDGNNTEWNSFVPDLFTIVNYCKERNKTIILVANIPASSANEQSPDNGHAKSAHMNDVHDAVLYVAESTGVECVDMYDAFNDYCINTNTPLGALLGDGLHPNDNGYDVYYSLIMPMIGVAIESAAESVALTPSIDNNNNSADLDIVDEAGNVLVRLENGNIRTKNFNSEIDGQISVGDCPNDLEVTDPAGNILMLLKNGHIMTKEFDSSKLGDEFNYYATEFETEEQALYDKVRNDIDDKTVVLLITTDAHITTEEPYTLKYAKTFRRMAENMGVDAIVSLGDIINEKVGTGWDITANRNRIELYMKDTRNTYIPFLYALAHHEMYSSGYPTFLYGYSAEKVLGKTDKYQRYMKPVFDSNNYANFYLDVKPQGLRMIFLDSTNVAGHPVGYTQATVDWLTSVLANSSGKIALFTHAPSKNGYSYNPTNNISKVVNDVLVRTALNTYVQGGGKVLGHYCGHAHCDNYGKESDMEYYIIQTACSIPRVDGGVPSNERPNLGTPIYYSNRTVGTINEWCIDVACIHTDINEVHLFRFGVGQDRSINL